jgi:hypothetical protein
MRRSIGYEAVGMGDLEAKAVLVRIMSTHGLDVTAALACYAILRAKENVVGCGKNTLLLYLVNNSVHHVFPDVIHRAEELFQNYERWENSSFLGSCPKSVIGAEVVWFEQLDGGLARA